MKKIVIATKNKGKLREMTDAFRDLPVKVLSLADFGELPEAVEDGKTFEENARIKARFYCEKTGCACIADDSGLEVAALGGAPGVHSARFSGTHADDATNNAKLMQELDRAGVEESPADYRCALVFHDVDGTEILTEGRCDGVVGKIARGTNGFGYDPYFYVGNRTIAEMSLEEKDGISHRGEALHKMVERLCDVLGEVNT
ncbi:MAG: RdgB/HAM1 family non-canonical purine NTP pyrophosphatase [Selenomonadaceae bacterium]|nr:RdgB/HAM1 family non-canonical purine NTP pyrophosphatase [Selenomonadaceae bacterium]